MNEHQLLDYLKKKLEQSKTPEAGACALLEPLETEELQTLVDAMICYCRDHS